MSNSPPSFAGGKVPPPDRAGEGGLSSPCSWLRLQMVAYLADNDGSDDRACSAGPQLN